MRRRLSSRPIFVAALSPIALELTPFSPMG
jgi:hypothetical protein